MVNISFKYSIATLITYFKRLFSFEIIIKLLLFTLFLYYPGRRSILCICEDFLWWKTKLKRGKLVSRISRLGIGWKAEKREKKPGLRFFKFHKFGLFYPATTLTRENKIPLRRSPWAGYGCEIRFKIEAWLVELSRFEK